MELQKQVTSLEISKRLKELGVKQESLFWWEQVKTAGKNEWAKDFVLSFNNNSAPYMVNGKKSHGTVSAFTVAELGEILKNCKYELPMFNGMIWHMDDYCPCEEESNTEADARGKTLIYLLENGLIK